jgi:FAD dependent oxidoreductase
MPIPKSRSAQPLNSHSNLHTHWGAPPWLIDFAVRNKPVPPSVNFAIVGGGFTGLAAAAWLRRLAPEKSVAVFEADRIGAGASGRTGGMALAESAATCLASEMFWAASSAFSPNSTSIALSHCPALLKLAAARP